MTKILVKYFFLFLFLFLINVVNAQSSNIKVIYKAYSQGGRLEDNEIIKKSKFKHLYLGLDNALSSLQFCLVANKVQSHYYLEDGLAINDRARKMATNFTGKGDVFINLSSKSFVKQKNILGDNYYVSWDLEPKWKLTNEKKVIEGYLCFKATSDKVIRINKNTNNIVPITAWYCPSIPFSFGPKEYFKLPGLILELQEDKVTFLATKIVFSVEIKDVVLDGNKTIISEEEYNIKLDQKTDDFFGKVRKNKK